MFVYVRDELDVFEGELESYIASVNQTGTLTPVSLQVKELMSVSEGKTTTPPLLGKCGKLGEGLGTRSRCTPGIIIVVALLLSARGAWFRR